ncbi:hypothetical protein [Dysgonomonas sp. Marseille-P4361]|uniref:hypothetical protein n=1 Tax=Dysgonomonas sp. Marseille-P4361 TaxID=2161820 RepID=UPI000D560363|nr:hypothetical protein [Dysgonomonas sp. Marseille-P4361]
MKKYIFNTEEIEDIEDSLYLIEDSLQVKLEENELSHVKTFEEFVDVILSKLDQEDSGTCTSQQVFYKLRELVVKQGVYDPHRLTTSTRLDEIFPRKNRKVLVKQMEKELGIEIYLIAMSKFTFQVLMFLMLGAILIMIFDTVMLGMTLFMLSAISFYLICKFTKRLRFKTVRELIEDILFYNYIQLRKDKTTVNKKELRKLFFKVYSKELNIDENTLQSASFVG